MTDQAQREALRAKGIGMGNTIYVTQELLEDCRLTWEQIEALHAKPHVPQSRADYLRRAIEEHEDEIAKAQAWIDDYRKELEAIAQ